MADFPDIPAGFGIPLVDMSTYLFPTPTVDALALNINSRLVVNVGDYDSIADAVAVLVDGSTLWIPAGTYNESVDIDGIDDLTIHGEGGIISGVNTAPQLSVQNCDNLTITGLKLRGTATGQVSGGYGLSMGYCNNVLISGCEVSTTGHYGMLIGQSTNVRVLGNLVRGAFKDGIHITAACSTVLVSGNSVEDVGDDGIACVSYRTDGAPCTHITVTGNIVRRTKARGISMVGGEKGVYSNNVVDQTSYAGIYVAQEDAFDTYGVSGLTVVGNRISGASTYSPAGSQPAIYVKHYEASWPNSDIKIADNTVSGSARGCFIESANTAGNRNVQITGNTFVGTNAAVGIQADYTADLTIRGNTIQDITSGIIILTTCTGVQTIEGNTVLNHGTNGIQALGPAYTIVRNNLVYDTDGGSTGAAFQLTSLTGVLILEGNAAWPLGKPTQVPSGTDIALTKALSGIVMASAAPSAGTWSQGQVVLNSSAAASAASGWMCTTSGTFGTLSGVTADTTNGSAVITVNDATNLRVGQVITIVGVSGAKRIYNITGTTVTLNSTVNATVSTAATTFVAPVFKAMANLAA